MLRLTLALVAALLLSPAAATEAGWELLRDGGQVVLLRHAMATGSTDPANFDIEKCGTQSNLSDRGKQQARNRFSELQKLTNVRDELDIEWGQLQLEQSTWGTHGRVERVARDDLRMVIPQTSELRVVQP